MESKITKEAICTQNASVIQHTQKGSTFVLRTHGLGYHPIYFRVSEFLKLNSNEISAFVPCFIVFCIFHILFMHSLYFISSVCNLVFFLRQARLDQKALHVLFFYQILNQRMSIYTENFCNPSYSSICFLKQIIHMARGNQTMNRKSSSYRRTTQTIFNESSIRPADFCFP